MSAGVSLKHGFTMFLLELFMIFACRGIESHGGHFIIWRSPTEAALNLVLGHKLLCRLDTSFFSKYLCPTRILDIGFHECLSSPLDRRKGSMLTDGATDAFLPKITPTAAPQPFLSLLAPSPLSSFPNSTSPKLLGLCMLNFSAAQSLMTITSIDCWAAFAPLLSAAACYSCDPCQGAGENLKHICSIYPSNLTAASCPVKDVDEFENTINTSELLASCEKIDPVKECCDQVCQGAISDAATRLALKASDPLSMDGPHVLPQHSMRVNDRKTVVLRWLASKLDPYHAKEVLRGLTNCNVNKVCPLVFPNMKHVANSRRNGISDWAACCDAMNSYVSH
ncbi:Detected protein of unknown function [Hibiscus syriacus]|uniref:At1g61900-like C-terminal domain-containing protein n=1 Tax=Hibiscus syriacus TaxID=106335 RepID=A0A6A2XL82_HIBSY|nr:Detected protein of unknown function [Hibiscus syriacus]